MTPTATPTTAPMPYYLAQSSFRKFTLDEYHKMIETGVLVDGEPYELLEGHLVLKMSRGAPHDGALDALIELLSALLPQPWYPRTQMALELSESEPEPDIAVVPGPRARYRTAHPTPVECRLVIEVANTSLAIDRHDKGRIYARAGIPVYWVVNVPEKLVEVYTQPTGTGDAAAYTKREDYAPGSAVPVVLDGAQVGTVSASDIFG